MANRIVFENARIAFRNFSGKKGQYNPEGARNFVLLLDDPAVVADLRKDGWNVKELKPRDDQDEPQPYIQVAVNYSGRPPKITLVTSKGKTPLDEDSVSMLDWAEIKNIDLIVNPYEWEVRGETGIKAYLKSMFVVIEEDELDMKYVDVPDSASNSLGGNDFSDEEAPF